MPDSSRCGSCGAPRPEGRARTARSRCAYCGASLPAPPDDGQGRQADLELAEPVLGAHRTATWAIGLVGLAIIVVGGVSLTSHVPGPIPSLLFVGFGVAWIAVWRSILKASGAAREGLRRRLAERNEGDERDQGDDEDAAGAGP